MDFKAPVLSDSLKKNLHTITKFIAKFGDTAGSHHMAFHTAMIRNGISVKGNGFIFFIPYGVTDKEHRAEIIKHIRNVILPSLGLQALTATSRSLLVHNGEMVLGRVDFRTGDVFVDVTVEFQEDIFDQFADQLSNNFTARPTIVNRVTTSPRDGGLIHTPVTLPNIQPVNDIHKLYPYFSESPSELWEKFEASSSNVMLLIGPPGLGKSSFTRAMLEARGREGRTYICDRTDVLEHKALSDFIRSTPSGSIIVTEDSDTLVARREDGNSGMAALLNTTSGIIPTDNKIIISTNLSNLRKVDAALLRPGRMFRVLEFKHLTIEQGHAVRETMGLGPVDFGNIKDLTLAEAINWHETGGVVNKALGVGYI